MSQNQRQKGTGIDTLWYNPSISSIIGINCQLMNDTTLQIYDTASIITNNTVVSLNIIN